MNQEQIIALIDLANIEDELRQLSDRAGRIMGEHFPQSNDRMEAYGALNFGASSNRFDTTFSSELESLNKEDDEDMAPSDRERM